MKKIISLFIVSIALTGCTSVCPTVGQTGSLRPNERGWTGLTGLGIMGVQGALCGAGLAVDKLQEPKAEEITERDQLYKTLIALEDHREKLGPEQTEQLQLITSEIDRINARIEEIEK